MITKEEYLFEELDYAKKYVTISKKRYEILEILEKTVSCFIPKDHVEHSPLNDEQKKAILDMRIEMMEKIWVFATWSRAIHLGSFTYKEVMDKVDIFKLAREAYEMEREIGIIANKGPIPLLGFETVN